MIGGIYSDQRCPICGGTFKDDGRKGLFCPKHPQCQATKFSVRFRNVHLRFDNYEKASQVLSGMRFKLTEGTFDERDYRKDNPLGFDTLARKYLEAKKGEISSFRQCRYHLEKAIEFFQGKNIKTIGYADLEDFLLAKTEYAKQIVGNLSAKTRANIKATLHAFWEWLKKREVIRPEQMPNFPSVDYTLRWRRIVDKETQQKILDEIYKLTKEKNIKIWIALKWLSTYISIRPKELLSIKEGDFDFSLGGVFIRKTKEKKPKFIPLLKEDIDLVKSLPPSLPHLCFFRHHKGYGGIKPGTKMERDVLYRYWKKACKNLGIENVDMYGGTRHSSAVDLRRFYSPEQIKNATMHSTNKAFERYFQIQLEDIRKIYQTSSGKKLVKEFEPGKGTQVIEIKR